MIAVEVRDKEVRGMLNRFEYSIPAAGRRGVYNVARYAQKVLKEEAKNAGLVHWGGGSKSIFKDTEARKKNKSVWEVYMPKHGFILDKGNYFTALHRGKLVTKWAEERFGTKRITGKSRVRWTKGGRVKSGFIFVTPKPFIQKAIMRTVNKARGIVVKEINKKIRSKGR